MSKKDRIDRMEKVLQIYHKYFKKLGKVPFKHQISNEDLSKMDKLFINPVVARACASTGRDASLAGWKNTELSINDYCQEKSFLSQFSTIYPHAIIEILVIKIG